MLNIFWKPLPITKEGIDKRNIFETYSVAIRVLGWRGCYLRIGQSDVCVQNFRFSFLVLLRFAFVLLCSLCQSLPCNANSSLRIMVETGLLDLTEAEKRFSCTSTTRVCSWQETSMTKAKKDSISAFWCCPFHVVSTCK